MTVAMKEKTMENQKETFQDLLEHFEKLESHIEKRLNRALKQKAPEPYESEKTDQICTALSKAQGEFPKIYTNRKNNFLFNQYTDLDEIIQAIRPALANNGLSITQQTKLNDDRTVLITRLRHKSAQFIETRSRIIPSRNDIQTYASVLKAMKRHDIMGLLNITIVDDYDDDDGERDMEHVRKERNKGTGLNIRYKAKEESFETITQDQENELRYVIGENADIAEQILETLKIQTLADMPKSKYYDVKRQTQNIVNARDGKTKN